MASTRASTCTTCRDKKEHQEFDAELAFRTLSDKYVELATRVSQYMSEAPLDRVVRNEKALKLSREIDRIVGGKPAPGRYPECCLVGQRSPNGSESYFCTGVLVHPQIVLTAAHCHVPPETRANVVALRADTVTSLAQAEIIGARRTVIHPAYATTGLHDIAVLILRKAATTPPVSIATTTQLAEATHTTLVGFGNNDVLSTVGFGVKREVDVPITHVRRTTGDDLDGAELTLGFESDLEFVAGGNGFDSCNGDSGGPAYVTLAGQRLVAGLTSRGTEGVTTPCGQGGVYTRVDIHAAFIAEVAAAAGVAFP